MTSLRAWMLTLSLAALLCCGDDAPAPDATPAVCPADSCEQINRTPPPCWQDPCPCADQERECDSERICRMWDDCDCYQCRVRFFCACE